MPKHQSRSTFYCILCKHLSSVSWNTWKKSTIWSHKRNCRCCCVSASTDIMTCMHVHRSICFSGFSAEKELNKLKLAICLSVRLLKLWKQHTRFSSTGDKCWVCKGRFKDGHHPLLVSPERHQVTAVDEIPSTPGWLLFVCRIIILNTPVLCITKRTAKKKAGWKTSGDDATNLMHLLRAEVKVVTLCSESISNFLTSGKGGR